MEPRCFDLNDIEHEPSDEQLAALMDSVAEVARECSERALQDMMKRLQAGLDAARSSGRAND